MTKFKIEFKGRRSLLLYALIAAMMLIILSTFARADEILLKNGVVMKNCQIVDTVGTVVKFKQIIGTVGGVVRYKQFDTPTPTVGSIEKSEIQQVIYSMLDILPALSKEAPFTSSAQDSFVQNIQDAFPTTKFLHFEKRYPNIAWLAIALGFGLAAIDFYDEAAISARIADGYEGLQMSSPWWDDQNKRMWSGLASDYRDRKLRKNIVGGGCVVAGIICAFFAFQSEDWAVFSNGMEIRVEYKP